MATSRIAELFGVGHVTPEAAELPPSWNVAPTSAIRAVLSRGGIRWLEVLRWGLVPAWAPSPGAGARMINARAEGLQRSPAFRGALARRRAIIPMDGFYEWQRLPGGGRQPYYFAAGDGGPLAVAGLWEAWRGPEGAWLLSGAIVTTGAAGPVAAVHDRMPVVLAAAAVGQWLDSDTVDAQRAVQLLLTDQEEGRLVAWPVGRSVNNVANDSPGLVEAVAPSEVGRLSGR